MRNLARQKLGYFPLSAREAERVHGFLVFGECSEHPRPLRWNGRGARVRHVQRKGAPLRRRA